jgi:hypothetical protein
VEAGDFKAGLGELMGIDVKAFMPGKISELLAKFRRF